MGMYPDIETQIREVYKAKPAKPTKGKSEKQETINNEKQ